MGIWRRHRKTVGTFCPPVFRGHWSSSWLYFHSLLAHCVLLLLAGCRIHASHDLLPSWRRVGVKDVPPRIAVSIIVPPYKWEQERLSLLLFNAFTTTTTTIHCQQLVRDSHSGVSVVGGGSHKNGVSALSNLFSAKFFFFRLAIIYVWVLMDGYMAGRRWRNDSISRAFKIGIFWDFEKLL